MQRRQFINRLALGAAAVVGSPVVGAAESRKLRVAVVGHTGRGGYGHGLDKMWLGIEQAEVVAVADPDPKGLADARKRLGNVPGLADYREMLKEFEVDIVSVAPRHIDQHREICLAAIAAGVRGIYIEKPFCRTPGEADEIIAACTQRNVKLAVAHRNRYHPVLPLIKQKIDDGLLGKVLEIRGRGKEDNRGGAQDLWVLGSHIFDLADYFAGPPLACSGMLYQDGRPCTREDLREGDEGIGLIVGNQVHARFEMSSGIPCFFDSLQQHGDPQAGFGLQIIGTGGVIDLRVDREPLAHFRRGNPHHPSSAANGWLPITSGGIDQSEPIANLGSRLASHHVAGEDLIAAIKEDRPPRCDAVAGRTTIEMICGVFESHRQGGARVQLPLQFRDHPLQRL